MRPTQLKSKIFLDSGDPAETKAIIDALGFLDGQTTNPTLVAKNPHAKARFERGDKFSEAEIYDFYKQLVTEVSELIPEGSVSIEVYASQSTTAAAMFAQGQEMFGWIPNAHIKYPIISPGLEAAEHSIKAGMRVNMTLCFTQEQAAAVYSATKGAKPGDVFVSPFIGRLDDQAENGIDLVKNILEMYAMGDGHVQVLAASARNMDHFMACLALGADIITAPFGVLKQWGQVGMPLPDADLVYNRHELQSIAYQTIDLNRPWTDYDIQHELTTKGVDRFAADWDQLVD